MRLAASSDSLFHEIPEGAEGTRATLKIMAALVKEFRANTYLRETCAEIVGELGAQNFRGEVVAIFEYVRDQIRYLQDANSLEVVQTPLYTLTHQFGDCDDKSTLLAAMLESVGHPCRFVAVGYSRPGEYEHVFVETRVGANWFALDATLDVDAGFAPLYPNVEKRTTAIMREWI